MATSGGAVEKAYGQAIGSCKPAGSSPAKAENEPVSLEI
jgi:hypothetical protein